MKNYKIVVFTGFLVAFFTSFFSKEFISPMIIMCVGLFLGTLLIALVQKEDHKFLINIFTVAFFSRIIAALLLYNLSFINNGNGLFGDGWCYSENGYSILQMWLSGMRNIAEIHQNMLKITVSGTLGSHDFWNAFVYFFTGKSPLSLIFINCLASSLTIIFVYQIAKQFYNKKAAVFAAFLTGFWPSTFLWSIQNLKEPISLFLICVLMWAVLCLHRRFRFYLVFLILASSVALKEFRIVPFFVFYIIAFPISLLLPFIRSKKIEFIFL